MDFIVINSPASLSWQANLCDLVIARLPGRIAKPPGVHRFSIGIVAVFVGCMGAMVAANVVHEGALTDYAMVQAVGLTTIVGVTVLPALTGRRCIAVDTAEPAKAGIR